VADSVSDIAEEGVHSCEEMAPQSMERPRRQYPEHLLTRVGIVAPIAYAWGATR